MSLRSIHPTSKIFGASLLGLLLLPEYPAYAQQPTPPPPAVSLYLELIGNTAIASVNADLLLPSGLGLRVGLLLDEELYGKGEPQTIVVVATLNYLLGRGRDKLELGGGVLLGQDDQRLLDEMGIGLPAPTATLGYRHQPGFRNVVVRAGFTPIWSRGRIVPRAGLSIGWQLP